MSKLTIAVYAIAKNEEVFVDRWMDSMQEADMVVVADAGSTDRTVEKLRARGATVHSISVDPWRFDAARNISLQLVPEGADVCVCTDLDEVLESGWREKLEQAWKPTTTRIKYWYTWSFQSDGAPGVAYWYEKIHRRQGFRWIHPVHEVLSYEGDDPDEYEWVSEIRLNHYPDPLKSRASYLPLLEMSVAEDPEDDRNMHYLGREYMFYCKWEKCIETLKKHLQMPSALWEDERCASMRYIAHAYRELGNYQEAGVWLYRAIAEAPYSREPYVEMARLAYLESDWPRVHHMVERTLAITERRSSYIDEPYCWDSTIYDLGAISCYELGMLAKACKFAEIAAEMSPKDERLKNNYELIKSERGST